MHNRNGLEEDGSSYRTESLAGALLWFSLDSVRVLLALLGNDGGGLHSSLTVSNLEEETFPLHQIALLCGLLLHQWEQQLHLLLLWEWLGPSGVLVLGPLKEQLNEISC